MVFSPSNRLFAIIGGAAIAIVLLVVLLVCIFKESDPSDKYADQRLALAKQIHALTSDSKNVFLWEIDGAPMQIGANFTFFEVDSEIVFYAEPVGLLAISLKTVFNHEQNNQLQLSFDKNGANNCYNLTENIFTFLQQVSTVEKWLESGEIEEKSDNKGYKWKFTNYNMTISFQYSNDKKTVSIENIKDNYKGLPYSLTQYTADVEPIVFNKDQVNKTCANDPFYSANSDNPVAIWVDYNKNYANSPEKNQAPQTNSASNSEVEIRELN